MRQVDARFAMRDFSMDPSHDLLVIEDNFRKYVY